MKAKTFYKDHSDNWTGYIHRLIFFTFLGWILGNKYSHLVFILLYLALHSWSCPVSLSFPLSCLWGWQYRSLSNVKFCPRFWPMWNVQSPTIGNTWPRLTTYGGSHPVKREFAELILVSPFLSAAYSPFSFLRRSVFTFHFYPGPLWSLSQVKPENTSADGFNMYLFCSL